MFKIGDSLVYNDGKIYSIVDVVEKDYGSGPNNYFALVQDPHYLDDRKTIVYSNAKTISSNAREIISKAEAKAIINQFDGVKAEWINDSKVRKNTFTELANKKDPLTTFYLIKCFHLRENELNDQNRSLTITDKKFYEKIRTNLIVELTLALNKDFEEIERIIDYCLNK